MRAFVGYLLILLPVGLLFLNSCLGGVDGRGGPSGTESIVLHSIFAMPMVLGMYLVAGGSRLSTTAHLMGFCVCLGLLTVAILAALNDPAKLDLDVVGWYLLGVGGVVFGTLAVGYLRARRRRDK